MSELVDRAGDLIGLIGDARLPVRLAGFLHDQLAARQVHIARLPDYRKDCIVSASHDGSDAASRQTQMFFDRRLYRFERPELTNCSSTQAPLVLEDDHTQSFDDPRFRSFGREVDVGARFVIRKSDERGDITIVLHWPLRFGDIAPLRSRLCLVSRLIAPIVGRHMALSEAGRRRGEDLGSLTSIEAELRRLLGSKRPRELQVGAGLIAGETAGSVARRLLISAETVTTHRRRLYDRLAVANGRELLLWYLSNASTPST